MHCPHGNLVPLTEHLFQVIDALDRMMVQTTSHWNCRSLGNAALGIWDGSNTIAFCRTPWPLGQGLFGDALVRGLNVKLLISIC